MKRNCLWIGTLGGMILLGWIAVASGQRGQDSNSTGNPLRNKPLPTGADSGLRGPTTPPASNPQTIPDAAALEALPLSPPKNHSTEPNRYLTPVSSNKTASSAGSTFNHSTTSPSKKTNLLENTSKRPNLLNSTTGNPPSNISLTAAEDSSGGPNLQSPATPRVPVERYGSNNANLDDRYSLNHDDRLAPMTSEPGNKEPAPFQGDPSAEPATSVSAMGGNRTLPHNTASDVFDDASSQNRNRSSAMNGASPEPNGMSPVTNGMSPVTNGTALGNGRSSRMGGFDSAANTPPASEGTGQPGSKQLEGLQSPQVAVQKVAPPEIQVGKPAIFKTVIRNAGTIPACQVEVRDMVPKGTRLLSTTPRATPGTRGDLVWTLGTLRPNEESSVEMEVMPIAEGEIGSVATVHFGADVSVKTISTRPQLSVQTTAPAQVLVGENVTMTITITNPGSGAATGVVLEEHIPSGLQHPAGSDLEYNVGLLRPGETKKLDLQFLATTAGPVTNLLTARADGNLRTEDRLQLEVVAPKLDLALEGPKKRYLEREATYQFSVSNPGTASAQNVELVAYLPQGMKFVSANNQGHYDEANRAVYWRLEQLPTKETGTVELVALPVEPGQQNIRLRGSAVQVSAVEKEQPVVVEGIAAVMFQVADSVDPVEVGGESAYDIRVMNQGSKAASNVRLTVTLPPELQPLAAEGPTRYALQGNAVVFEGLARLAPKAEAIYRVRIKGTRPGDLRAQFQLQTDEMQRPVTKEESTQVYTDE